jgi:hypothetical protein
LEAAPIRASRLPISSSLWSPRKTSPNDAQGAIMAQTTSQRPNRGKNFVNEEEIQCYRSPCGGQRATKRGVLGAGHNSLQQQSAICFEPKKRKESLKCRYILLFFIFKVILAYKHFIRTLFLFHLSSSYSSLYKNKLMYHFFAKNKELKSKKESKTSTPSSAGWGPSSTSWHGCLS